MNYPEMIICFKCNHDMTKGDTYIGESSNMWPIGQMYHCDFCHESVGITEDGRITHCTARVIGVLVTGKMAKYDKEEAKLAKRGQ